MIDYAHGGLFVKMTFWGLFSKFDLLISSPVPSQGVSQYLIIDKLLHVLVFRVVLRGAQALEM